MKNMLPLIKNFNVQCSMFNDFSIFAPKMEQTESLIVKQLKDGQERAYKYLYDRHYQVLCYVAAQYVKDDFLAETIVGDVIFHLWEVRETVTITTSLRSYLMTSVRHRCMDYLKSQHSQHEVPVSTTLNSQFSARPEGALSSERTLNYQLSTINFSDDSPLGRLLEQELEGEVMKSIGRLPEDCRRVFRMSRFEEKKYDEIAHELQISVNTVKYHIKHALALLHEDLRKYL